ncbi:MAG: sigma-54-dependent Fis family transcriptional regulator [Nitrospirae bacterium]|nr:sigma-54-dependent Fis family transcriptional regulator [Nitrospirota bacterium]
MKLKALLYLDEDFSEKIKPVLHEEDVEVFDLYHGENLLDEISRGYLDILFFSCSCKFCNDDVTPTIKKIKQLDPRIEIICVGTREDDAQAIEAIKCGATACIGTPFDLEQIREIVIRTGEHDRHRKEILKIETALQEKYIFADMVSKNPEVLDIFTMIKRIAPYYRTMLIQGDTGTGKEVLAKAVHKLSPAPNEPFIVCNCSGLVENLIESELFGHVKGAFTGAVSNKEGLFEAAGNGTIFLDEIGHMPLSFQPHLLRILQDGEFRRVGSTKSMKAGCKIIAATNVDLAEEVKKGNFREDLFFRLSVVTINIPPLRERKEDIPLLSRFFLDRLNKKINKNIRGITMDVKRIFMSYNWPGNIRELENVIERAILVTTVNFIRSQDLPSYFSGQTKERGPSILPLDEMERNHIQQVLIAAGGNKSNAASLLRISRRALGRKLNKYGLGRK